MSADNRHERMKIVQSELRKALGEELGDQLTGYFSDGVWVVDREVFGRLLSILALANSQMSIASGLSPEKFIRDAAKQVDKLSEYYGDKFLNDVLKLLVTVTEKDES